MGVFYLFCSSKEMIIFKLGAVKTLVTSIFSTAVFTSEKLLVVATVQIQRQEGKGMEERRK